MSDLAFFFNTPLDRSQRTVLDIASAAMQKIGAIDASRPLTANEARDCLDEINGLLEQWSMESLNVYRVGDIRFVTASGQTEYKIGPGEYIDAERPAWIWNAVRSTEPTNTLEVRNYSPVEPPNGYVLNYDPGFPVGTITLGWTPTGEEIALRVDQQLRRYESVSETHGLPPGYERPLTLALAIALSPAYDQTPSQTLMREASIAKATLRKNAAKLRIKPLTTGIGYINDSRRYSYNVFLGR